MPFIIDWRDVSINSLEIMVLNVKGKEYCNVGAHSLDLIRVRTNVRKSMQVLAKKLFCLSSVNKSWTCAVPRQWATTGKIVVIT